MKCIQANCCCFCYCFTACEWQIDCQNGDPLPSIWWINQSRRTITLTAASTVSCLYFFDSSSCSTFQEEIYLNTLRPAYAHAHNKLCCRPSPVPIRNDWNNGNIECNDDDDAPINTVQYWWCLAINFPHFWSLCPLFGAFFITVFSSVFGFATSCIELIAYQFEFLKQRACILELCQLTGFHSPWTHTHTLTRLFRI